MLPAPSGSTLEGTWADPAGDGILRPGPGEPLVVRSELAAPSPLRRALGTIAHITDAHVLDASSPARVSFLDRLGPPFGSTFRPQEALTLQVLAGAVAAVRALAPDAVVQGGDLIDNAQANELRQALAVLSGGEVRPGSGAAGYHGVQLAANPDPAYYRPDVDEPRHPGLLEAAVAPFAADGLGCPWLPVLGDHDILVAGELVPNPLLAGFAVGDRALWTLPEGVSLPPDVDLRPSASPDGPPFAGVVTQFLLAALQGPSVPVPADPGRRLLEVADAVGLLRAASGDAAGRPAQTGAGAHLDYVHDLGGGVRLLVLDLASRLGGSGGQVTDRQVQFVESALASAGERWVVFISHQTLRQSAGGERIQELLDASPRVILLLNGHTHHNRIRPRETAAGGHWEIETSSLVDWPQQARALRLWETEGGGVAIETWMLDHVFTGELGRISRELAHADEHGGRPGNFAGSPGDRNALLHLPPRLGVRR